MTDTNKRVVAEWSGEYPCLCSGNWTLIVDGKDVSNLIPEDLRDSEMDTAGTYSKWHFDDDWMEVFDEYEDGLECEDWIKENREWLDTITSDHDLQQEIFDAINAEDWRHSSCGGCI